MRSILHAEIVDPRYITAEEDDPAYRVDFWSSSVPGSPARESGWLVTEEWRVTGAGSVQDVLTWAEANSDGRQYVLAVEFRNGPDVALVRLAGHLPGRTP